MLEAVTEPRVDGLPWQVDVGGRGVMDAEGHLLFAGNIWLGPNDYDERMVLARQRAELTCKAVNMHHELTLRLAELTAIAAEMFRRLDEFSRAMGCTATPDSGEWLSWQAAIRRGVETMEKVKGGQS